MRDVSTNQLCQATREFASDARGNFATMTAILLMPMLGFTALAIDHWSVATAKSDIENAADPAALGAINRASAILKATGNIQSAIREGAEAGANQFGGNVGKIPKTSVGRPEIVVKIDGMNVTSRVKWSGVINTWMSSMFGWNVQNVSGEIASSLTLPAYTQIHVLVDNSGSMGIGATAQAQEQLFTATNCAIACHLPGAKQYEIAQEKKINTRIDIVRQALMSVAQGLESNATTPNLMKIAVSSFSNDVVEIIKISDEAARDKLSFQSALSTKAGTVGGLELTRAGGGTDFHGALAHLDGKLHKRGGTGFSESDPLIYVVFITDGIEHTQEKTSWWRVDKDAKKVSPHPEIDKDGRATYNYKGADRSDIGWVQTLDPKLCEKFTNRDIKMLTLEIEYLIPDQKYWGHGGESDVRFGWIKDNLHVRKNGRDTLVNNRFTACASKGESYRASSADEIQASMTKIFDKIIPRPPRLLK